MAELCAGGAALRDQVNKRFPKRDKTSDGWIGDTAHAERKSDHNPDSKGIVHAWDLDQDFGAPGDPETFCTQLLAYARAGKDGGRLKYVIYEGRIASGTYADKFWKWRPYDGANAHTKHIHLSFTNRADRDGSPWRLPILEIPAPAPAKKSPARKAPAKKAPAKKAAKKAVP